MLCDKMKFTHRDQTTDSEMVVIMDLAFTHMTVFRKTYRPLEQAENRKNPVIQISPRDLCMHSHNGFRTE